ncbi:hypothetical protein GGS20DRAFT_199022 [Poronia punctata]|nr:hypothetical protein GGS20DRAFT_199022 [Poronia punctata]
MSSGSGTRVRFSSNNAVPRSILKNSDKHAGDSGVGSSSSDHTGSSGTLDEGFTARDFDIQSNDTAALREALRNALNDLESLKVKYDRRGDECRDLRKKEKQASSLYQDEVERSAEMEDRMKNLDRALLVANKKIRELEEENTDLLRDKEDLTKKHEMLEDEYSYLRADLDKAKAAGYQKESKEMTNRMKSRINRETGSSRPPASKSSHSSDGTSSSKRSSRQIASEPYIEPLRPAANPMISPSPRGSSYPLAGPELSGSSRRPAASVASNASSSREHGNYVPHPLPDRTRHRY